MKPWSRRTFGIWFLCFVTTTPARAAITYLGAGTIPANATDNTGLLADLEDGTPGNLAGGMGSAIAYSGVGNRYYMATDRGPGDGSTTWLNRMYTVQVAITPSGPGYTVTPTLEHASLFNNEAGVYFVGNSSAFDSTNSPASRRLDPEGLRVSHSGTTVFVSDEFGPFIYEFDLGSARRLRSIPVPPKFLIANPDADTNDELPPNNMSGRQANRSMEGLAISPDGSKLYGLVQSPLLQDGALSGSNNRIGTNCRLLEMNLSNGSTREFLYQLSSASIGATEILAVNDHEFLVLERDGRGLNSGNSAQFKKIFRIDIAAATDISGVTNLPTTGTPLDITPVSKLLFLDILVATGIPGSQFPEKLEGITFGPNLPDGRHVLLVSADNDFKDNIDNWFLAFAIDPLDLPGYVPQDIAPVVDAGEITTRRADLGFAMPGPHPMRDMARFEYALSRDGHVKVAIYDARGRCVRRLLDRVHEASAGTLTWDGRDDTGRKVAPGTYFARLQAHGTHRVLKFVLIE